MTLSSETQTRSRFHRLPANFMARLVEHVLHSRLAGKLDGALVVVLPDGKSVNVGQDDTNKSTPILKLNNFGVVSGSIRRGSLGFAEAYLSKDIECRDLPGVLKFYLRNRARLHASGGHVFKARWLDRLAHLARRNSMKGSQRNISEHYDLGNAFYKAWLDQGMNYSSGVYCDGVTSLEEAQLAKLDRVRTLVSADPGDSILEVGCGWGALACRTAELDHVTVTGITLSHEQLRYARERARQQNLSHVCTFHLQDYRVTSGSYDHVVSIEMIEAVGEAYWRQYFDMLSHRLKNGGSAVIQAITIDPNLFERYRRRPDFIQRYIFPGGMLPTLSTIKAEAEQSGLSLVSHDPFGKSYAETLRAWRQRFDASWPAISELGFDERFRRQWRYYLMYCEAGFDEGAIDVGLYKLVKKK